jgi:hypothetical protein
VNTSTALAPTHVGRAHACRAALSPRGVIGCRVKE